MSTVQGYAARALAHVSARAQGGPVDPAWSITLNFHPDRSVAGLSILDAFARSPGYRTQYETATSNGGLTAYPGGDRWRWEQRIFGGAYDDAPAQARPRYGALNHRGRAYGGAPRLGSAHLRLRAHTWHARRSDRIQLVDATPAGWSKSRCSLNASAGVFQPRVLRGLVLRA